MNLLYLMVLVFCGASVNNGCIPPAENATSNEINILYNSTELTIEARMNATFCTWGSSECYVECTILNFSTNATGIKNVSSVIKDISITEQNKIIVFKISEQEVTCNVAKCVQDEISALIINSSNSNDMKDLRRPARIRNMCKKLFASAIMIKKAYIRAEKKLIDVLINLPFNETTKKYNFEEFNMTVVQMDMMNATDLGLVQISAPTVPDDNLPLDVFIPTEPFLNELEKQHKVGVVTYPSAELFTNDPNTVLKSKIIRIETVGQETKNLAKQLVINFTLNSNQISENHTLSCRYYNLDAIPELEWDDMGSFTSLKDFNSSNTVTCSYNHMTPFAVLLIDMPDIDPQQWKILSYISYIGCGLSSFFSAVTLFIYSFMKSSMRDSSLGIHVSLSVAVFLLNTSFLFIEWGATWSQDSLCVLIAVIIQYSLLSCFSWMAIEAIHLYLLLIKVFNTYMKNYMIKLSLFGWGVPAVLVGGSLCVFGSYPFYGTVKKELANTNEIMQLCWIIDARFLYGMNITYFCLMFLFNTSILVAVTHQICRLRRLSIKGKLPSHKDVCTVLGLSFLLGMTWSLAFFTSGYTNYPILYLFCICNTLQGLFLFLWFYATMQKNRRFNAHTSSVSDPTSSTANAYESSFIH